MYCQQGQDEFSQRVREELLDGLRRTWRGAERGKGKAALLDAGANEDVAAAVDAFFTLEKEYEENTDFIKPGQFFVDRSDLSRTVSLEEILGRIDAIGDVARTDDGAVTFNLALDGENKVAIRLETTTRAETTDYTNPRYIAEVKAAYDKIKGEGAFDKLPQIAQEATLRSFSANAMVQITADDVSVPYDAIVRVARMEISEKDGRLVANDTGADVKEITHEIWHAVELLAEKYGIVTKEDLAKLEAVFGKAQAGDTMRHDEEAAADRFGEFIQGQFPLEEEERGIFRRILDFAKRIFGKVEETKAKVEEHGRAGLTAENVFKAVQEGRFGSFMREAPAAPAQPATGAAQVQATPETGTQAAAESGTDETENGTDETENGADETESGTDETESGTDETKQDAAEGGQNAAQAALPNGKKIPEADARQYRDDKGELHNTRWSKFLGREISAELDTILDRLQRGENVSEEEISSTPEWREALQRKDELEAKLENEFGSRSTHRIQTPERKRLQDDIVFAALSETITGTVDLPGGGKFTMNEALGDGQSYTVARERKAAIIIGLPSAGKSSVFANPISLYLKARVCDSDAVKAALPEFDNGYGANAVHEESSIINARILNAATELGDNIVLPIVGADAGKLQKRIDFLRQKGYNVSVYYNELAPEKALGRLVGRYLATGRFLPLHVISNAGNGCRESYNKVKNNVDEYAHASNDVPYGQKPRIIESSIGQDVLAGILGQSEPQTGRGSDGRPGRGRGLSEIPGTGEGDQSDDRTPETRGANQNVATPQGAMPQAPQAPQDTAPAATLENPADPTRAGQKFYRIKAADGVHIVGEIVVSDADELRTSYKDKDRQLEDKKLQNRLDDGVDRADKITKIAANPNPAEAASIQPTAQNGMIWTAPGSKDVFIGNARATGFDRAYKQGNAAKLEEHMRRFAREHGVAIPEGMAHPIVHFELKRIEDERGGAAPADIYDIVSLANKSQQGKLSNATQAADDARLLRASGAFGGLEWRADGSIDEEASYAALQNILLTLPDTDGLLDANRMLTREGAERIKRAVMFDLLEAGGEGEGMDAVRRFVFDAREMDAQNEFNALAAVASELIRLAGIPGKEIYDLRGALENTIRQYARWRMEDEARRDHAGKPKRTWKGKSWNDFNSQLDMFNQLSPVEKALGDLLAASREKRSFDKEDFESAAGRERAQALVRDVLRDVVQAAMNVNTDGADLFAAEPPGLEALMEAVRHPVDDFGEKLEERFSLSAPGAADWGDEERTVAVVKRAAPPWRFVKGKTTKEAKAEIKILAKANIAAQPNYAALPNDETPALRLDGVIFKIPLHNLFHAAGRRLKHTGAAAAAIGDIVNASVEVPGVNAPWHYRIAALDFGAKSFALITAKTTGKTAEVVEMQTFQSVNVKTGDIARELNHTNATRPDTVSIAELKAAWQEFFEGNLKKHNESAHGAQKQAGTRYPDAAATGGQEEWWDRMDESHRGEDGLTEIARAGEKRFAVSAPSAAELAEAERQYNAVVARYTNPDGSKKPGWMKAPNGKPTKLTERQWVQVRTANFKRWFGDWEALAELYAARDFVLDGAAVASISGNEFQKTNESLVDRVVRFYEENGATEVESPDLGIVALDKNGVNDSLAHGIGRVKAAAFALVPEVIRSGKVFARAKNWKGRGYDSAVIAAPVKIGADDYVCEVIVRQLKGGGNRFYLHEVNLKENVAKTIKTATGAASLGDVAQPTRSILAQRLAEVNPSSVSKVVDENGEPLAVYHGSHWKPLHENPGQAAFRHDKTNDLGFHFGTLNQARDAAGDGTAGAYFLNLRSPLRIKDQNINSWTNDDFLRELGMDEEDMEEFWQGVRWGSAARDDAADGIKDFLAGKGYDSLVYENEYEGRGKDDSFVAIDPGQIKSATDNTGVFGEDTDIRYSISHLFTGAAADYANRDENGNIVNPPSLHHVGTGEGAQVYGWGLYASNVRGVAESYAGRRKQSQDLMYKGQDIAPVFKFPRNATPEELALKFARMSSSVDGLLSNLEYEGRKDKSYKPQYDAAVEWVKSHRGDFTERPRGNNLYEQTFFTDRPEGDESHLLNWYEPVTDEQKEWIGKGLQTSDIGLPDGAMEKLKSEVLSPKSSISGGELYSRLRDALGSAKAASEFLARAGIDGVKYPVDSYGKTVKDGDKAGWNYVSFRDDNIRVDHKWTDGVQRYSVSAPSAAELAEAERQYNAVVARYTNPDGSKKPGWMKAPNGKPTKLTERQWVQVRTDNFKRWFGDWEALAYREILGWYDIAEVDSITSITPKAIYDAQPVPDKAALQKLFKAFGEVKNILDGRVVRFPVKSAGKMIYKKNIASAFKMLFETSVKAFSEKETLFQGHKSHPNANAYHHYVNKFKTKEGTFYIRFTVRDDHNGSNIHSAEVSDIEIYNEIGATQFGNQTDGKLHPANSKKPFVDNKLTYFLANVNRENSVSRVVDENGEPLVVWRGRGDTGGVVEVGEDGAHFTTDEYYARSFGKDDETKDDGNQIAAFINSRKPLDLRKAIDESSSLDEFKEKLRGLGLDLNDAYYYPTDNPEYQGLSLGQWIDKIGSIEDLKENPNNNLTDYLGSLAWKHGFDSIVTWEFGDREDFDVIVRSPGQIKSATDNTGVFGDDTDIRYSIIGAKGATPPWETEDVTEDRQIVRFSVTADLAGADLGDEEKFETFRNIMQTAWAIPDGVELLPHDVSPRRALEYYDRHILGKSFTFPGGETITMNRGHFFRLTCEGKRNKDGIPKGYVAGYANSEEALEGIMKGEVGPEQIYGWQSDRAGVMPLFGDLVEHPAFILQDKDNPERTQNIKRYDLGNGRSIVAVFRMLDNGRRIISFHGFSSKYKRLKQYRVVYQDNATRPGTSPGTLENGQAAQAGWNLPQNGEEVNSERVFSVPAPNVNGEIELSEKDEAERERHERDILGAIVDAARAENERMAISKARLDPEFLAESVVASYIAVGRPIGERETADMLEAIGLDRAKAKEVMENGRKTARDMKANPNVQGEIANAVNSSAFFEAAYRRAKGRHVSQLANEARLAGEVQGARFAKEAQDMAKARDVLARAQLDAAQGFSARAMESKYGFDMVKTAVYSAHKELEELHELDDTDENAPGEVNGEGVPITGQSDNAASAEPVEAPVSPFLERIRPKVQSRADKIDAHFGLNEGESPRDKSLNESRRKLNEQIDKANAEGANAESEAGEDKKNPGQGEAGGETPGEAVVRKGMKFERASEFVATVEELVETELANRMTPKRGESYFDEAANLRELVNTTRSFLKRIAEAMVYSQARALAEADIDKLLDADSLETYEAMAMNAWTTIQRNAIRQTARKIVNGLIKEGDKLVRQGSQFSYRMDERRRKARAETELWWRQIRKYFKMSEEAVAAEAASLRETLDKRIRDVDAAEGDYDIETDRDWRKATDLLAALSQYGGLVRRNVAEIERIGADILATLERSRDALVDEREEQHARNGVSASRIRQALANPRAGEEGRRPELKGLSAFFDSMIGILHVRLRNLVAYSHGQTRTNAEEELQNIEDALAIASETASVTRLKEEERFRKLLAKLYGSARTGMRRLSEALPDEERRKLVKQGVGEISRAWLLQRFAELLQSGDYETNIAVNKRDGKWREDFDKVFAKYISSEDMQLMAWIRDWYRTNLDELNKKLLLPVTGIRQYSPGENYFPVKMKTAERAGFDPAARAWSPIPSWLTPRVRNSLDFDETTDIISMWHSRMADGCRQMAYSKLGLNLAEILFNPETKKTIVENHGKKALQRLQEQVRDVLAGRAQEALNSDDSLAAIDLLRAWQTNISLSFNPLTAIKQCLSMPVFALRADIPLSSVGKYMLDFSFSAARDLANSDFFKARYGEGISEVLRNAKHVNTSFKGIGAIIGALYNAGFKLNEIGDSVPGFWVGQGLYRAFVAKIRDTEAGRRMSEDEIKRLALARTGAIIEQTQQSSRLENLNALQRGASGWGRLVYQFASSPVQQAAFEINAFREYRAAKGSPREGEARLRLLRVLLINHLIMPFVFSATTQLFNLLIGAVPDPEEWRNRFVAEMVLGPFSSMIFVGAMAKDALYAFSSGKRSFGSSGLPVESMGDIFEIGGKTLHDLLAVKSDDLKKDILDLATHMGAPPRLALKIWRGRYDRETKRRNLKNAQGWKDGRYLPWR